MILQTVLLWSILVPALVLGHLDLPLPGDGGRGIHVDGDCDAGVAGGDEHVLACVEPAGSNKREKLISILPFFTEDFPGIMFIPKLLFFVDPVLDSLNETKILSFEDSPTDDWWRGIPRNTDWKEEV